MNIAVVEDDNKASALLVDYLHRYAKENNVVFTIECFSLSVNFVEEYTPKYDIVFMDIQMPLMSGMEAATILRKKDSDVILIFITEMAQYAVQGYEVDAKFFLVKPVSYTTFETHMKKALAILDRHKEKKSIVIRDNQGIKKIAIDSLLYIEVQGHHVLYHTQEGVLDEWRVTLAEREKELTDCHFFRCNNYTLVNLHYVSAVKGNTLVCGKDSLEFSRNRRTAFLEKLTEYMGNNL